MQTLQGKAVVVTGAGRGLGAEYAVQAAREGASVLVNDVDVTHAERVAQQIVEEGGRAVASGHSVADAKEARAIVETCVGEFGAIDGLVNNAGLNYEAVSWRDDPDDVRELIGVNVLGTIYTGVAAADAMAEAGGGSIVNISSGASFGQRRLASYAASKGAVASLTYSWALDMEEIGVQVNAVCPVAYTRMVAKSSRRATIIPPDRGPDLVAPLVLFLLSDAAAGITGQLIRCNGEQLHVVGQPYFKAPILRRDRWDVDAVRGAFDEVFGAHLEPYGLEKRVPPRLRKWVEPLRTA
ncbi:MAG: SDR family NAD(P)-dependent oxidoreductase [Thermocrispum sp.]